MAAVHSSQTLAGPADAGPARNIRNRRIAMHLGIFVTIILAWEFGSRAGWLDPLFYPRPSNIMSSFWLIYFENGNVWYHIGVTMSLVFAGFFGGSVLGIVLGSLVGLNGVLRQFLKPYVIVLEATPRIAVAPWSSQPLGSGVAPRSRSSCWCAFLHRLSTRCQA